MGTVTLIGIDEYLQTSYDPDCDYIDGRLEERNLGRRDHSALQAEVAAYLVARKHQWGIRTYTEQRLRIYSGAGLLLAQDGILRASEPDVTIPLAVIFAGMR